MVDEFSAFARMPQPVIKPEDVGRIAREALVLQKTARPQASSGAPIFRNADRWCRATGGCCVRR